LIRARPKKLADEVEEMIDSSALEIMKATTILELPKIRRFVEVSHKCCTDFLTARKLSDLDETFPLYFETLKVLIAEGSFSHTEALAHLEVYRKVVLTNVQLKKALRFFVPGPKKPKTFPKVVAQVEKSSEEEFRARPNSPPAEVVPVPVISEPLRDFEDELFVAPEEDIDGPQALESFEDEEPEGAVFELRSSKGDSLSMGGDRSVEVLPEVESMAEEFFPAEE